jgi:uncharacterized RDD family membrane protein YckC
MPTPNPYASPEAAPAASLPAAAGGLAVAPPAEFAGFGVRAGARILDTIFFCILSVPSVFVAILLSDNPYAHAAGKGAASTAYLDRLLGRAELGGAAAYLLYGAGAEWIGGATLGKMLLGLRVRSAAELGPCNLVRAVVRHVAYYIDAFFFGFVAYGAMSKSPTRQRLGDRWAGTVVVRAASLTAGPPRDFVVVGAVAGAVFAFLTMSFMLASP